MNTEKTYKVDLSSNCVIVYPGTFLEENITETGRECEYCIYDNNSCGHFQGYGQYCDWMTFHDSYKDLT